MKIRKKHCVSILATAVCTALVYIMFMQSAFAHCCGCPAPCSRCKPTQTEEAEVNIRPYFRDRMTEYRNWFTSEFFISRIQPDWMLATQQLSTVSIMQVGIVGGFFDAKHLLETTRLMDKMRVDAIKEYQPSEAMCRFATVTTGLASTEQKQNATQIGYSEKSVGRLLLNSEGNRGSFSSLGEEIEAEARVRQFRKIYCDKDDNAGHLVGTGANGAKALCGTTGGTDPNRLNNDVNYTKILDQPLTLNVGNVDTEMTTEEQDILALADNIYHYKGFEKIQPQNLFTIYGSLSPWISLMSYASKSEVAQSSFYNLVSEKSAGTGVSSKYFIDLVQELGYNEEDAKELFGEKPSYYAQMELLTKKLYQNPNFFVSLIDTPNNVNRQLASLETFEVMQKRDFYHGLVRQEMLLSLILEELTQPRHRLLYVRPLGNDND